MCLRDGPGVAAAWGPVRSFLERELARRVTGGSRDGEGSVDVLASVRVDLVVVRSFSGGSWVMSSVCVLMVDVVVCFRVI